MQRHNHYEAAFEDYLRSRGWSYIPVNEQKKLFFSSARIKSFDFIVYRPGNTAWLVDIKGRKMSAPSKKGRRYWENWVTQDDLDGLRQWEGVFGKGFEPVFIFVYWLTASGTEDLPTDVHPYRDRHYALAWVSAGEYAAHAKQRSAKWQTVMVPSEEFRNLLHPISEA